MVDLYSALNYCQTVFQSSYISFYSVSEISTYSMSLLILNIICLYFCHSNGCIIMIGIFLMINDIDSDASWQFECLIL